MTRTLLVVAHEASRSGAPQVLLDLLRTVREDIPLPMTFRIQADGPLSSELLDLGHADTGIGRPAGVIVNGALAANALLDVEPGTPAIAYVHEEQEALAALPDTAVEALVLRSTRVLCVSTRSVRAVERLGVDPGRISILPPIVPDRASPTPVDTEAALLESGLAPDRQLVIGCGEGAWRKGPDLFVDVARRVVSHRSAQFAWAGRRSRSFARVLDHDCRVLGLEGSLRWLGELADVGPLLAAASLLLVTSREDPQPLVPLEAAQQGTATAGFAVGGIVDLADEGAAASVPYPDTVALAAQVCELLDDREQRASLASAAESRRRRRHSAERVGQQFLTEVLGLIRAAAP